MKRIAMLTSGGDAPGMNACIRAVVRTCAFHKLEAIGIFNGYEGLIDGELRELTSNDVSNIIQRGGTILKSSRSQRFFETTHRAEAFQTLVNNKVDGLIVMGGDGTFKGAKKFGEEFDIRCVGIPCTIDNDLFGTDWAIGYDTALNTVVAAVDKIRDTASSHDRLFFVEVMGKDAGFIALRSGIGVGAEAVLIPETKTYIDRLVEKLETGWRENKRSCIIMVAEGNEAGGAYQLAKQVKQRFDKYDMRVTVLGHIQRGGNPSAMDRVVASRLGAAAVETLLAKRTGVMVGLINNQLAETDLEKATKHHKEINLDLLRLAEMLSL